MSLEGKILGLLSALAVFSAGTPAHASPTYNFMDITHNLAADAAIGEAQLFMEVAPTVDPGKVQFHFTNTGPEAASITDVYFEDGSLLGIAQIIGSAGVSFSSPATPPDLPGGASVTPPFVATEEFSTDSDSPVQPNGVNPGDVLWIVFTLQSGRTYADVLSDLTSADLRIGIHVQGFASGGSESFINDPSPNAIPSPGAVLLCALGAGLVDQLRRHRMLNG